MDRLRVPIIVSGEIRWLERGRRQDERLVRSVEGSGLLSRSWDVSPIIRALQLHRRSILTFILVIVSIAALFGLMQILGPRWSPLLLSLCGIVAIFSCLGKRRAGTLSAYSIFNEGTQRLPGQLSADDIDRQIRGGGMMPVAGPPPPPQLARQERRAARRVEQEDDYGSDDDAQAGVDEERLVNGHFSAI